MKCGEGIQAQNRNCINGTIEKCNDVEKTRKISCNEAGTRLDDCKKLIGIWKNSSSCQIVIANKTCGLGVQYQNRTCKDGRKFEDNYWKTDNCTKTDKEQKTNCSLNCAGILYSKYY